MLQVRQFGFHLLRLRWVFASDRTRYVPPGAARSVSSCQLRVHKEIVLRPTVVQCDIFLDRHIPVELFDSSPPGVGDCASTLLCLTIHDAVSFPKVLVVLFVNSYMLQDICITKQIIDPIPKLIPKLIKIYYS